MVALVFLIACVILLLFMWLGELVMPIINRIFGDD